MAADRSPYSGPMSTRAPAGPDVYRAGNGSMRRSSSLPSRGGRCRSVDRHDETRSGSRRCSRLYLLEGDRSESVTRSKVGFAGAIGQARGGARARQSGTYSDAVMMLAGHSPTATTACSPSTRARRRWPACANTAALESASHFARHPRGRSAGRRGETQALGCRSCHDGMLTVTPASSTSKPPAGPPSAPVDDDGDRISITDVNGTIARFEMTYEPPSAGAKVKFGPPLRTRIPSALYLAGAIIFSLVTWYAYNAPTSSRLFVWAVEGDRIRPLSVSVIAVVLLVSSMATVTRTHMRGVIVTDDWIEARYLLPLGIPRARRWGWPEVTRILLDGSRAGLELYHGSFERLPEVADGQGLVNIIVHHAGRHRIAVSALPRSTPR